MMSIRYLLPLLAVGALTAGDAPLGSKDFYPSPEHPVRFLGDGSGHFPGATPVSHWQEGTPKKVFLDGAKEGDKGAKWLWTLGDDQKVNIVWKTNMPGWVNSQPIVVGDLVFTYAEPNQLVCVDAHSGKILWTRIMNVYALDGRDPKLAEHLLAMRNMAHVLANFQRGMSTNPPYGDKSALNAFGDFCDTFSTTIIPRLAEELKRIDPQGEYTSAAAKSAAEFTLAASAYHSGEKPADGRDPPFKKTKEMGEFANALEKRISSLSGIKTAKNAESLPSIIDSPWGNMIGWQMSVPVSDGRHVYASLGQGATACYDLQGNLIWARSMPCIGKNYCSTVYSPLVVDGIFVDVHRGEKELVGLDAQTGEEKWRTSVLGEFTYAANKSRKIGSHRVLTLSSANGGKMNVIVTIQGNVIRPKDGKSLCAIPYNEGSSPGGPTLLASGDIVMLGGSGDNFSPPYVAFQLTMESADTVVAKEIWRQPKSPGECANLATPTAFIISGKEGGGFDVATGKLLFPAKELSQYMSKLLLGDVLIGARETSWLGPQCGRVDGVLASFFSTWSLSGSKITSIQAVNILGGIPKVHSLEYDTYAPELMANPRFHHNWGLPPGHNLHTDNAVFASGNRIYIRTVADLYCIGDPAVKYDWNPAARPKDIAVPKP